MDEIKVGDIFEVLMNGAVVPKRKSVIVKFKENGDFFTMAVFEDMTGKRNFRPGAGGTAGRENIGKIIGYMEEDEIKRLFTEVQVKQREFGN